MFRKCPVCGNHEGDIPGNISMCLPEGFTFADVKATQKDYDDYYSNHNVYDEDVEIKQTDENVVRWYSYLYGLLSDKVGSDAKILDVSCGNGGFYHGDGACL